MNFFDKKEEVIEVRLTQYGKFLLSQGEFVPKYYAFFDEDIIYDHQYGFGNTVEETQNNIQKRIKDSQYLKCLTTNTGIESNLAKQFKMKRNNFEIGDDERDYVNMVTDHEYFLTLPLGTSGDLYEEHPAWDVKIYSGKLNNVTSSYSSSNQQVIRIPQLNLDSSYFNIGVRGTPESLSEDDSCFVLTGEENIDDLIIDSYTFKDGTSLHVEDEYILLEIAELNTLEEKENFSIEVFIEEQDVDGNQVLTPLKFAKQFEEVDEDGLLKTEAEMEEEIGEGSYLVRDRKYIENYLEILTDTEISEDILCKFLEEGATYGFLSRKFLKCEPDEQVSRGDIYAANFNDEVELCDD